MKVVFLSHTAMGGSFVVGSHHFARAFAGAGHTVTHLSAPVSFAHIALAAYDGFTRTRVLRCARGGQDFDGVQDVVPLTLIPWKLVHFFPWLMNSCSTLTVTAPFRGFTMRTVRRADWLIVDDPRLVGIATRKTTGRLMYRATDLYAEMNHDRTIVEAERILCARADVLVATSEIVAEHLEKISGRSVHVIRNGVEFDMFTSPLLSSQPLDLHLPGVREARAVYVGSFDSRFGMDALRTAAASLPDKQFILIGPGSDIASTRIKMNNVTALGAVAYSKLPAILAHCAVGLLPLSSHPANAGRSPMKLYEYAAAGLTIAATTTRELSRRILATLSLADNDRDFAVAVRRAFHQAADSALVEVGREEAARESWVSKANQLLDLLKLGRTSGGESATEARSRRRDGRSKDRPTSG